MKPKLKLFLHFLISFALSFITIYLFVFFGGWKLFESGNPIFIELGAAVLFGIVLWIVFEHRTETEKQIKNLEKRIENLEKRIEQPKQDKTEK